LSAVGKEPDSKKGGAARAVEARKTRKGRGRARADTAEQGKGKVEKKSRKVGKEKKLKLRGHHTKRP